MSYKLRIPPKDRASGRFIALVRKALISAAMDEKGVSQQSIANKLGVNRSVVNRLLRGESNLTLRSIGELAWALEYKPSFKLEKIATPTCSNYFEKRVELDLSDTQPNTLHSKKFNFANYESEDA
ncbi:MAG: helix-turn-helix domain-containing protein [Phyllobacterium sp.]